MAAVVITLLTLDSPSYGGLILDANGNLFGTTEGVSPGDGTVFELPFAGSQVVYPDGFPGPSVTYSSYATSPTTLVTFNGTNGAQPDAGLIADANGNLFGTTAQGGQFNAGTVFEIPWNPATSAYGTPVTLVSFNPSSAPFLHTPQAGLFLDSSGDLIGTTASGGIGFGTIFELIPNATGYSLKPLLHAFSGHDSSSQLLSDGAFPQSSLVADSNGNLFGTTFAGGIADLGTVFELVKNGSNYTYTPLFSFGANNPFVGFLDGANPSGLIADAFGNLFGTTQGIGGSGTIFELQKSSSSPFGYTPITLAQNIDARGAPIGDANGNLFVMDHFGQLWELPKTDSGYGSLILLNTGTPVGTVGGIAGTIDRSGLVADANGNLFGTTTDGVTNNGPTVFEIANTGFTQETVTSVSVFHQLPGGLASGGGGVLGVGSQVAFWVYFSAPVLVSGAPTLSLSDGETAYSIGATGVPNLLVFDYTVQAGDHTSDLTITKFNFNGGTVQGVFGGNADVSGALVPPIPSDVLVVDTTPPTVTIFNSGGPTNHPTQTISGTVTDAEVPVGSTVTLFDNGTPIGTALVTGGSWSKTVTLSGDGPHNIMAQNTDAAGNVGSGTVVFALDQDTGEQVSLSFIDTLIGSAGVKTVQYMVGGIDPSDDTAVITFKDHLGGTATATVNANGLATADLSTLVDGSITASMVVTDAARNSFDASASNSATLDAKPPHPVMLDAVAGNKSTTLSGTAEANCNVSIFEDGNLIGTTRAGSDGSWSLQTNPITGNTIHSFTETAADLAGNTVKSTGVTLYTPASNEVLKASTGLGAGTDVLIGRPNDTLVAGSGPNTFVFNPSFGKETITGFDVTRDVIRLDHTMFPNANPTPTITNSSGNAVIVVDSTDTITLVGVTVAQLNAHLSDFSFF